MPSWWIRRRVDQHDYNRSNSRSLETISKNKGKCSEKQKTRSFDESILQVYRSSRNSLDLKPSSLSISGFSGFDSDVGSENMADKKAYPLPKPSSCSSEPLMSLDKKLLSSASSSSSLSSSTSSDDGVDLAVNDHGELASFRNNILSKDVAMELPSEKQEKRRHPCHPLPLPPAKSSHNLLSTWKKGKLLGRGTFGHVYAAFNSDNGQMCAMKEVRFISDDQNSTECLKQLNQEIALLSELSHPNIVQYYGSKMDEDKLSVYLEYVSGGSIQKLLNEYGAFAEPVIRSYTKQILCGLAYLHRRNTVHRDIKGANILVDPNGEIKLADFGMAKHIKSVSSMLSFKGSPYWMAPEVILNTSSYSLAVDIWSLGCTVLEMATSKPPWSEYEGVAAMFKIANSGEYPIIPTHLSKDAESFVKLCLQRDPSARPTAAQLLHHPFVLNQDTREVAIAFPVAVACRSPCARHPMAVSCFHCHQASSPTHERDHVRKHITQPSILKISSG